MVFSFSQKREKYSFICGAFFCVNKLLMIDIEKYIRYSVRHKIFIYAITYTVCVYSLHVINVMKNRVSIGRKGDGWLISSTYSVRMYTYQKTGGDYEWVGLLVICTFSVAAKYMYNCFYLVHLCKVQIKFRMVFYLLSITIYRESIVLKKSTFWLFVLVDLRLCMKSCM